MEVKLFCMLLKWWRCDIMHLAKLIELYTTKSDSLV